MAERVTGHLNRCFPIAWTEEEQAFARCIQMEVGRPQDGMATTVWLTPNPPDVGNSTEVGHVSWNTPTMGAIFAAWPLGIPPHQWGCTACNGMSIGRKAVIQAAHVMASTGLALLTEPEFLQAARTEFAKRTGGKRYVSLNVDPVPPGGRLEESQKKSFDCVIHAVMEHFGIEEGVS